MCKVFVLGCVQLWLFCFVCQVLWLVVGRSCLLGGGGVRLHRVPPPPASLRHRQRANEARSKRPPVHAAYLTPSTSCSKVKSRWPTLTVHDLQTPTCRMHRLCISGLRSTESIIVD